MQSCLSAQPLLQSVLKRDHAALRAAATSLRRDADRELQDLSSALSTRLRSAAGATAAALEAGERDRAEFAAASAAAAATGVRQLSDALAGAAAAAGNELIAAVEAAAVETREAAQAASLELTRVTKAAAAAVAQHAVETAQLRAQVR